MRRSSRIRRVELPRRTRRLTGVVLALLAALTATANIVATPPPARAGLTGGYWLVGTDGGVFTFGEAGFHGSTGDVRLNQPIVGMTPTPTGKGYWMVASDGGIFAFGDAGFFGSTGGAPLNKPIVGMAPTPTGRGYWLVASDGGIFAFGDAPFLGSMGATKLNKPVVDMASTPSGKGYWLVASDGGIFAFGDAPFAGSTGAVELAQRIHAMAATPTGKGYWMVAGDGGIFAFGDARFHGAAAGTTDKRVLDIAPSGSGLGYFLTTSGGEVFAYGDAKHFGDTETAKIKLNNRIAAMAAMTRNERALAAEDSVTVDEDGTVTVDVLGNDRDPEGGALSLRSLSSPLRGTAVIEGDKVVYKPNADYHGGDLFTYTLVDRDGATSTGRVNVTVRAVNDKPAPRDDSVSLLEDVALGIPVLFNDGGLGDGVGTLEITSPPGNGTAVVSGKIVTYRSNPDFSGEDSFEYKVTDVDGDSGVGKVRAAVTDADDVLEAVPDFAAVEFGRTVDIDVKANDSFPDGFKELLLVERNEATGAEEPIDRANLTTALGGAVRRDRGKLSYKAPSGQEPFTDEFKYVIVDRDGDVSAPAVVSVTVGANPPARLCETTPNGGCDPFIVVVAGSTYRVPVGELDKLVVDSGGDSLEFQPTTPNARSEDDGSIVYGPTPAAGTRDTFTFVAHDGNSPSNERSVRVCSVANEEERRTEPCHAKP